MPKIVKSWNDFMEVNVGFLMTWGMSETKTRNWSAKFIPEHLHLTSASTHTVCSSYANNLFRVFRIQMTYLAYLREKNLKRPSSNSCPNGEVHVRNPFWSRQCKCRENRESRNPPSLPLLKTIASLWKSGKANNEHFNKKFLHEEITLFSYQA